MSDRGGVQASHNTRVHGILFSDASDHVHTGECGVFPEGPLSLVTTMPEFVSSTHDVGDCDSRQCDGRREW